MECRDFFGRGEGVGKLMGYGISSSKVINFCNWNLCDAGYLGQKLTGCGMLRSPPSSPNRTSISDRCSSWLIPSSKPNDNHLTAHFALTSTRRVTVLHLRTNFFLNEFFLQTTSSHIKFEPFHLSHQFKVTDPWNKVETENSFHL